MPRSIIGVVTSDKQDKTIMVKVEQHKIHPLYRKRFTVTNKFHVHDEKNEAKVGDTVEATETRPISRHKTMKLVQIIERSPENNGQAATKTKEA